MFAVSQTPACRSLWVFRLQTSSGRGGELSPLATCFFCDASKPSAGGSIYKALWTNNALIIVFHHFHQVLWFCREKWVQNKYDFDGMRDVSMLVVLRFSKLNGQMNSKDLAMVGGFLFSFFCFFSWHSQFGTWFWSRFKTKTADKKGRGPWLLLRQEQECKKQWKRSRGSQWGVSALKAAEKMPQKSSAVRWTGPVGRRFFSAS